MRPIIVSLMAWMVASASLAAPPEFKKGIWSADEDAAGVSTDLLVGGKLAARCGQEGIYLELTPFDGFGAGGRPDREIIPKFDGEELEPRPWWHNAGSATISDYDYVQSFLRRAQIAKEEIALTATDSKGKTRRFRFSVIESAKSIRLLAEACQRKS